MIVTKIFKSGNSAAVRLPKTLRLEPGTEVEIISSDDGIHIRPVRRKICLDGIMGSLPGFMAEGRIPVDLPERDWPKEGSNRP